MQHVTHAQAVDILLRHRYELAVWRGWLRREVAAQVEIADEIFEAMQELECLVLSQEGRRPGWLESVIEEADIGDPAELLQGLMLFRYAGDVHFMRSYGVSRYMDKATTTHQRPQPILFILMLVCGVVLGVLGALFFG